MLSKRTLATFLVIAISLATFLAELNFCYADLILDGKLFENGEKLNPEQTLRMTLRIYDDEFGGQLLYEEKQKIVAGSGKSLFTFEKGKMTVQKRTSGLATEDMWVEVESNGQVMTPRLNLCEIGTVNELRGSSISLNDAGLRTAGTSTLVIDNSGVTLGSLLSMGTQSINLGGESRSSWPNGTLSENSVTAIEIAAEAVGSSEIKNNSITANDLATNSVGSDEIQVGAVNALEIATGAVGTSEVKDNSLTAADLAANSVTSSEIAGQTITANDLSSDLYSSFVNVQGDYMTGRLNISAHVAGRAAVKAANKYYNAEYVTGYLGLYAPGSANLGLPHNPGDIGVLGVKLDEGSEDGVAVYAWNNDDSENNYSIYSVADGDGESSNNYGIYAKSLNAGDYNYGGYFDGSSPGNSTAYGLYSTATSVGGTAYGLKSYAALPAGNNSNVYAMYSTAYARGTGRLSGAYHYASHYGTSGTTYGSQSYAIGSDTGVTYGVFGESRQGSESYGGYFRGLGTSGIGIRAYGESGYAGDFYGRIRIRSTTGTTVVEIGEGLDYAEGFDVSTAEMVEGGSVMIIDPDNPGKLKLSNTAYDTKVAGIVAGAKGLGSGVRLGADQFDHDVALAGRVYCNVDATLVEIKTGDLLTTSSLPGYAMKAVDYTRSHGAILGKAMEAIEKGCKGQILVLVTLQ
ncbi:hypothetical protein KAI46_16765 [bacterium]|nr:hypothetical protein [bacterium]